MVLSSEASKTVLAPPLRASLVGLTLLAAS